MIDKRRNMIRQVFSSMIFIMAIILAIMYYTGEVTKIEGVIMAIGLIGIYLIYKANIFEERMDKIENKLDRIELMNQTGDKK